MIYIYIHDYTYTITYIYKMIVKYEFQPSLYIERCQILK